MRGRKPGSLVRCRCVVCGDVEVARGTGGHYRCSACKAAERLPEHRERSWFDTNYCGGLVQAAIRDGLLMPARGQRCADCEGEAVEYDHRDYNKPLAVEPVCRSCNLRRGPAIPRPGTFQRLVNAGAQPYRLRLRVEQLFCALGIDAKLVADLPRRLSLDHWRSRVMPLLDAATGPDRRTAKAG